MRVDEVMLPLDQVPLIGTRGLLKSAIEYMTKLSLGVACIVNEAGQLEAVLTDGDLRRVLLRVQKPIAALMADDAISYATTDVVSCSPTSELEVAVAVMGDRQIWDLPVVDGAGRLVGVLHLHPAAKKLLEAQVG